MISDLRSAFRQIALRPVASAAMAVVLSIGLGFSTAIFILISSFTSAPPAGVTADDRVVRIRGIDRSRGPARAIGRELSAAEVAAYSEQSDTFDAIGAWSSVDVTLDVGVDGPDLHSGAATFVTPAFFEVLGLQMQMGAGLPANSADVAVVLSDVIWDRFYRRDPHVIGRTLRVNAATATIVGVAPRRFVGARSGGSAVRVWLPTSARAAVQPGTRPAADAAVFGLVARLQPGVSHHHASAVAATVAARFSPPTTQGAPDRHATDVVPLYASNYFPPSGDQTSGAGPYVAMAVPLLVLLITCTSVSSLLAGHALARRREVAVRLAMGASRGRVVRQLLAETAVLAACGGALALLIVAWTFQLVGWAVEGLPLVMDWRSGVFAGALALVASVMFGLSPALHATRMSVSDVLKESDPSPLRQRLQATLVIAQIASTQPALLTMGALLVELRSVWHTQSTTSSDGTDRVLEVAFNTNPRYGMLDDGRDAAIARAVTRLAATPGIVAVAPRPALGEWARIDGAGEQEVPVLPGSAALFAAEGWRLTDGRLFDVDERDAPGVAMVNTALAERLWGTARAVGRQFEADNRHQPRVNGRFVVVGVVAGAREPQWFVPALPGPIGSLLVRTADDAATVLPAVHAVTFEAAPEVPIVGTRTRASIESAARATTWRAIMAAGSSGMIALLLSAIGLYAAVAVAVHQRRREIGIRGVLGADRRRVTYLFLRRGMTVAGLGLILGLVGSALVIQLLSNGAVFGVSPESEAPRAGLAVLSVVVSTVVMSIAAVAAWIPARRAASVDPLHVLRAE